MILFDPIFQGLAISLMAGEVASLLLSRMTVPVLYYMTNRHLGGPARGCARRGRDAVDAGQGFSPARGEQYAMTVERALRLIAGVFVFASVLAGTVGHPYFFWFTAFVGLNLFQSAFTNWCPMMTILRAAGLPDADGHRAVART